MSDTNITEVTAQFSGETAMKDPNWDNLTTVITERITERVGDIEMHRFEATLFEDDTGVQYYDWEAEVKIIHIN